MALRYAKESVVKGLELPLADGLRLEGDLSTLLRTTEDRAGGRQGVPREAQAAVGRGDSAEAAMPVRVLSRRLNRRSRPIYLQSDAHHDRARCPTPERLRPAVARLADALRARGPRRPRTSAAQARLVAGSPARSASRRARAGAGRPSPRAVGRAARALRGAGRRASAPLITLWMRTARAEARGRLPHVPAHAAPRGRPPPRLHAAAASATRSTPRASTPASRTSSTSS